MIDAHQPRVPLFARWTWQEKLMKPIYLSAAIPSDYLKVPEKEAHPPFYLHSRMCFERLVRSSRCNSCFYGSISTAVIQQFKQVAYSLVQTSPPLPHHFSDTNRIVVTFAHRGYKASRHIANAVEVSQWLSAKLPSSKYYFRVVNTSNDTRLYTDQIQLVAEAQVIIAEHGAFQSNIVYLRNGSLLVDLRGAYPHKEYQNFQNLARMFGVFCQPVQTSGLTSHHGNNILHEFTIF